MKCLIGIGAGVLVAMQAGAAGPQVERTFGEDIAFLKKHVETVVLTAPDGKQVAVVPAYQGRVMTSSAGGEAGTSFGWLNYPAIERGILPEEKREGLDRHILVFGGEERFWLGPEGGQHAIYFPPGTTNFVFEVWKTPALIDSLPFQVTQSLQDRVVLTMLELEGRSVKEICAATGASSIAVRVRGVRVLFSEPGSTADALIGRLVRAEPPGRCVVVVSSDAEVAGAARRAGAWPVASDALLRLTARG